MIIENTEKKPFKELSLEERKYIANLFAEGRQEELERYMNGWVEMGDWCGLVVGRVYRTKAQQLTLDIPWDVLEDRWKFASMGPDGSVWVYMEEPNSHFEANEWFGTGRNLIGFLKLSNLPDPSLWERTLTKRPVVEECILSNEEVEAVKGGVYGRRNRDEFLEWVGEDCDNVYDKMDVRDKLEDMNAPVNIQEYFEEHHMPLWYSHEVRDVLAAFYK